MSTGLYVSAQRPISLQKSVMVPTRKKAEPKGGKSPVDELEKDAYGHPDYSHFGRNKKKLMQNDHQILRHGKGGKWHVNQDGDVSYDKPAAGFTPKPVVDPEGKPVKPFDDVHGFMKELSDACKRARVKVPLHVLSKMAEAAHEAAERSIGDHRSLSEKGVSGDNEKNAKQKVYTEPFMAAMKVGEEYLPGDTLRPLMERFAGGFRDGVSHHLSDGTHSPIGMTLGAVARHHVTGEERRDGKDVPDVLTDDKDKQYHEALTNYTKQVKGSSGPASGSKKWSNDINDSVSKLKETGKHHAQDVKKMRQRTNEEDAKVPVADKEARAKQESQRTEAEADSKVPPMSDDELRKLGEVIMELHINPDRFAEVQGLPEGTRSGRQHFVQGLAKEHEGESAKIENERQSAETVLARALVRALQHRANGHITNGIEQGGSKAWHIIAHGNTLKDRHQMARSVVEGAHNEPENSIASYLGLDSMRVARQIVQSLPDPESYAKELMAAGMVPKEIKGGPDRVAEEKKATAGAEKQKTSAGSPGSLIIKSKREPKLFLGFRNSHPKGGTSLPISVRSSRADLFQKALGALDAKAPKDFNQAIPKRMQAFQQNSQELTPNHTALHSAHIDEHVYNATQQFGEPSSQQEGKNPYVSNDIKPTEKTGLLRQIQMAKNAYQLHKRMTGGRTVNFKPNDPLFNVPKYSTKDIDQLHDPDVIKAHKEAIKRHEERMRLAEAGENGPVPLEGPPSIREDVAPRIETEDPIENELMEIRRKHHAMRASKYSHGELNQNGLMSYAKKNQGGSRYWEAEKAAFEEQQPILDKYGIQTSKYKYASSLAARNGHEKNSYYRMASGDNDIDAADKQREENGSSYGQIAPEDEMPTEQPTEGTKYLEKNKQGKVIEKNRKTSFVFGDAPIRAEDKAYPYVNSGLFEHPTAKVNDFARKMGTAGATATQKLKYWIEGAHRPRVPRGKTGSQAGPWANDADDVNNYIDSKNKIDNAVKNGDEDAKRISDPHNQDEWEQLQNALTGNHGHTGAFPSRLRTWIDKDDDHPNSLKTFMDGMSDETKNAWQKTQDHINDMDARAKSGNLTHHEVAMHYLWGKLTQNETPFNTEKAFISLQHDPHFMHYFNKSIKGDFSDEDKKDLQDYLVNGKHDIHRIMAMTPEMEKEKGENGKTQYKKDKDGKYIVKGDDNDLASLLASFSKKEHHTDEGEGKNGEEPMNGWDRLHKWHSDADMTGRDLRRNFWKHGMGGSGINNKILSLTSNMLGKRDVGVVDTIHAQHLHPEMWNKLVRKYGDKYTKGAYHAAITNGYDGVEGLAAYESMEDLMKQAANKHYANMSDEDKQKGLMAHKDDLASFNNGIWLNHDRRETHHSALNAITNVGERGMLKDHDAPTSSTSAGDEAQARQYNETQEGRKDFKDNVYKRGDIKDANELENHFGRVHMPGTQDKSWDHFMAELGGHDGDENSFTPEHVARGHEVLDNISRYASDNHGVGINLNRTAQGIHFGLMGKNHNPEESHRISQDIAQHIEDQTGGRYSHGLHFLTDRGENTRTGLNIGVDGKIDKDKLSAIQKDIQDAHAGAHVHLLPNGNLRILGNENDSHENSLHSIPKMAKIEQIIHKNNVNLVKNRLTPDGEKTHFQQVYWKGYHHDEQEPDGSRVFKSNRIYGQRWTDLHRQQTSTTTGRGSGRNSYASQSGWRSFREKFLNT